VYDADQEIIKLMLRVFEMNNLLIYTSFVCNHRY